MTKVREYELEGIRVYDLKKLPDERGFLAEVLRQDWRELLHDDRIVQANISVSYPGIIRAWHRHARGQVDYLVVLDGVLKIAAYDDRVNSSTQGRIAEIVASADQLQAVRIPGYYWHGTKTLGCKPSVCLYFFTKLYDYTNPDEERRPWNDATIIDPRTDEPYDWN